ncbi:MAG: DUF4038 domain-containing protein [Myxococcota bacterium]
MASASPRRLPAFRMPAAHRRDGAHGRRRSGRLAPLFPLVSSVLLLTSACSGGGGGDASGGSGSGAVFPIAISSDRRYLVDQQGDPFPILGRTAWFVTSLPEADYRTFIDDSVAKGFNAIEFHVINHWPRGESPPLNGRGELPFLKKLDGNAWTGTLHPNFGDIDQDAPDLTTPNEPYWAFVDALLAYAESKGVLCFMFPAYVGFPNTDQGWMNEMVANGPTKMRTYGEWIVTRYRDQRNLVWMAGGDMQFYDVDQTAVEAALIAGMKSVPNPQSKHYSAEWSRGSIATDQTDFGSEMTLNGSYANSVDVNNQGRRAYADVPTLPAFLLEEPFDEEGPDGDNFNPDATQPVRRFQWWGVLSNIGGYIAGNGYVWRFTPGWQSHLDTAGARDMKRLNDFVRGIAWYRLVPSGLAGMPTLVTDGEGSLLGPDYVAAAATRDGSLLVAYVPPDHSGPFTLDMTVLGGPALARWFNPHTAAYTTIGTLANVGTHVFDPPGDNGSGWDDWVLVLERP